MEQFLADQLFVSRRVLAFDIKGVPLETILKALSKHNIESAVWDAKATRFSGLIRFQSTAALDVSKMGQSFSREIPDVSVSVRERVSLISAFGLNIGGRWGVAERILSALKDRRINVEFLVTFPSQVSLLVTRRAERRAVEGIARALCLLDTSVVIEI